MKDLEAAAHRRCQGCYLSQNSPSHLVAVKTQAQSSVSAASKISKSVQRCTPVHLDDIDRYRTLSSHQKCFLKAEKTTNT